MIVIFPVDVYMQTFYLEMVNIYVLSNGPVGSVAKVSALRHGDDVPTWLITLDI